MSEKKSVVEQVLAMNTLMTSVGKGSEIVDKLSSWLLGGYAATVAILIGRPESSGLQIPPHTVHAILVTLLIVAAAGVIEKFLSAVIVAAGTGNGIGRGMAEQTLKSGESVDAATFITMAMSFTPRPMRWLLGGAVRNAARGNFKPMPYAVACAAQLQGFLVLLQAAWIFWIIFVFADTAF